MEGTLNMNKLKVEHEDSYDPAVHASGGLDIGVLQHTFDVSGVNFNDQIPNT